MFIWDKQQRGALYDIFGAIGSVVGAAISANASENAANEQAQSDQNALNFQKGVFGTDTANEAPYLQAGDTSLSTLQSDLPSLTTPFSPTAAGLPSQFSYNAADFQQSPGYQFAVQQGQKAIENSAAARGGDVSGGALKSLDAYTTGMADQDYNQQFANAQGTYQQNYSNAFNTYNTGQNNTFSRLASLVGVGQGAASQQAAAGANFANNAGAYAINAGNAQAAGSVGVANAVNSGISGATSSVTNGLLLNQLLSNNNSSYGGNNTTGTNPYGNYNLQMPSPAVTDPSAGIYDSLGG